MRLLICLLIYYSYIVITEELACCVKHFGTDKLIGRCKHIKELSR